MGCLKGESLQKDVNKLEEELMTEWQRALQTKNFTCRGPEAQEGMTDLRREGKYS